jgi:membrane protease YdiL (CAAX protease family)
MCKLIKKTYFKYLILPIIFLWVSLLLSYIFKEANNIDLWRNIFFLIFYVLIFALIEEIIFRLIIQWGIYKMLKYSLSWKSYWILLFILPILTSSILFTIAHKNHSFSILFLSFFLGIVYYYYKNIFLNIYIHMFNNILALIILYYL